MLLELCSQEHLSAKESFAELTFGAYRFIDMSDERFFGLFSFGVSWL